MREPPAPRQPSTISLQPPAMNPARRLQPFLTVARLTTVEVLRQPIALMLALCAVVLTALVPLTLMHNFGEDGRLVRDSALAIHFFFGLFFAGYAASAALARELRGGTAAAVLSTPVSREVFFLAKFAGVAAAVLAFSACAALATLLSERVAERFVATAQLTGYVTDWQTGKLLLAAPAAACLAAALRNYRARRPFGSTAFGLLFSAEGLVLLVAGCFDRTGQWAPYHWLVQWRILPVSFLIAVALVVLAAIAITLSTRLPTAPTVAICSALFAVGLVSDYLLGQHAGDTPAVGVLYGVVPNWQHFWLADALRAGGSVPPSYVVRAVGYAAAYAAAVLCIGMLLFRHGEIRTTPQV